MARCPAQVYNGDVRFGVLTSVSLVKVLAQLPCLQNLTLKACPVADQQGYQGSIISLLPQLQILDSQKVSNAALQAKQQTQQKSAKQPSAQRSAVQPQEEVLLSNSINRIGRADEPAKQKATQASGRAPDSTQRKPPVSSGTDKAAGIASRPVSKRKQTEQLDDSGTANAKAGHGPSHGSSGAQEGEKGKQATNAGKGVHRATAIQEVSVRTVAGEPGKKKPRRDVTAAPGGVQSQEKSMGEDRETQHAGSMDKSEYLGTGVKTLQEQTRLAASTAKVKPSKKLKEQKGKASASVLGKPQAQASRKAQRASQALASGKEVGLLRSKLHCGRNKHPSIWCAGIKSTGGHFTSQ